MERNIILNSLQNNVKIFCKAIHSTTGQRELLIDPENTTIGTFAPQENENVFERVSVKTITLDGFISILKQGRIDILKIDVEGNEYEVLKSAKQSLENIKKIVLEYHSDDLKREAIDFLKKYSFELLLNKDSILYFKNQKPST